MPVRLILAGSSAHAPEGQRVAAAAAALTAMVSAAAASSSQKVLARVRSFVHSEIGRCGADGDGQRGGGKQQPEGTGEGAELRPFRVQCVPHASLRRSRKAARARASAAQAQVTANPAHGASGK